MQRFDLQFSRDVPQGASLFSSSFCGFEARKNSFSFSINNYEEGKNIFGEHISRAGEQKNEVWRTFFLMALDDTFLKQYLAGKYAFRACARVPYIITL
ncbi:MAG: hypothetical protein J6T94_08070 [Bacteroidaceae bacterium]|nr:hypothetical protein [Bacteroidaceae bacterium]